MSDRDHSCYSNHVNQLSPFHTGGWVSISLGGHSSISEQIIMKSLDPLRAKKTFIRKKLGHTAVSAIKASSVTPINLAKGAREKILYICKF